MSKPAPGVTVSLVAEAPREQVEEVDERQTMKTAGLIWMILTRISMGSKAAGDEGKKHKP